MGIVYTKKQILELNPCYPWNILYIPRFPYDTATPQVIYDYLVSSNKLSVLPWFMGSFLEGAKGMIEEVGVDVNITDEYNRTALHFAVMKNKLDVIYYLLSKGADKNIHDKDNWSPIIWAEFLQNPEIITAVNANVKTEAVDGEIQTISL